MTGYVILTKNGEGTWDEGPRIDATSSRAAITKALKAMPPVEAVTVVAVPVRSWDPVTAQAQTQIKLA